MAAAPNAATPGDETGYDAALWRLRDNDPSLHSLALTGVVDEAKARVLANAIAGTTCAGLVAVRVDRQNAYSTQIKTEGCRALTAAIRGNAPLCARLTSLSLRGQGIGAAGVVEVAALLQVTPVLNKFDVGFNGLKTEGATIICRALLATGIATRLESLGLAGGPGGEMDSVGVTEVVKVLKVSPALTKLDVGRNKLKTEGVKLICRALIDTGIAPKLESLGLAGHGGYEGEMGSEWAVAVAELLKVTPLLNELNLSRNNIGPAGAFKFANGLKFIPLLKILNLAGNGIGPEGAVALADGLKFIPLLNDLDLVYNYIGPTGAAALADALKFIPLLKILNLWGNGIGPEGAVALADGLKFTTALTELNLDWNNIGPEGAAALAANLRFITALTTLILTNNKLDNAAIETVIGAVPAGITTLDLRDNLITHMPLGLLCLPHLQDLKCDGNPLVCPPAALATDWPAVQAYLEDGASATEPLRSLKLMLVGAGNVGKSVLRCALLDKGGGGAGPTSPPPPSATGPPMSWPEDVWATWLRDTLGSEHAERMLPLLREAGWLEEGTLLEATKDDILQCGGRPADFVKLERAKRMLLDNPASAHASRYESWMIRARTTGVEQDLWRVDDGLELRVVDFAGQFEHYAAHDMFVSPTHSLYILAVSATRGTATGAAVLDVPAARCDAAVWLSMLQSKISTAEAIAVHMHLLPASVMPCFTKTDLAPEFGPACQRDFVKELEVGFGQHVPLLADAAAQPLSVSMLDEASVDLVRGRIVAAARGLVAGARFPRPYVALQRLVGEELRRLRRDGAAPLVTVEALHHAVACAEQRFQGDLPLMMRALHFLQVSGDAIVTGPYVVLDPFMWLSQILARFIDPAPFPSEGRASETLPGQLAVRDVETMLLDSKAWACREEHTSAVIELLCSLELAFRVGTGGLLFPCRLPAARPAPPLVPAVADRGAPLVGRRFFCGAEHVVLPPAVFAIAQVRLRCGVDPNAALWAGGAFVKCDAGAFAEVTLAHNQRAIDIVAWGGVGGAPLRAVHAVWRVFHHLLRDKFPGLGLRRAGLCPACLAARDLARAPCAFPLVVRCSGGGDDVHRRETPEWSRDECARRHATCEIEEQLAEGMGGELACSTARHEVVLACDILKGCGGAVEGSAGVFQLGGSIELDENRQIARGRCSVFEGTRYGKPNVAIKVVAHGDVDAELLTRFNLTHPNIVQVFAVVEHPAPPMRQCIVMERAYSSLDHPAGLDLVKGRAATVAGLVSLARGLLEGLVYLHTEHIVHGDIKPGNVLVFDVANDAHLLKLADFGASRALDRTQELYVPVMASPRWAAPEAGHSLKSDVYSLGLVLEHVLESVVCTGPLRELAHELCESMRTSDPGPRPSSADCLGFPLFWSDANRCAFVGEVQQLFFRSPGAAQTAHLDAMSTRGRAFLAAFKDECYRVHLKGHPGTKWGSLFPPKEWPPSQLSAQKMADKDTVAWPLGLLTFIRNITVGHSANFVKGGGHALFESSEELYAYALAPVPWLVPCLHRLAAKQQLHEEFAALVPYLAASHAGELGRALAASGGGGKGALPLPDWSAVSGWVTSAAGDHRRATVTGGGGFELVQRLLGVPPSVCLVRVEAVVNHALRERFEGWLQNKQGDRLHGGLDAEFPHDGDKPRVYGRLERTFVGGTGLQRVHLFYAWHGCPTAAVDSICARGAKDLRRTDGGYFGAGPYVALQPEYAAGYATGTLNLPAMGAGSGQVADGEYPLVLCLVAVGNVYPVTRSADYVPRAAQASTFCYEVVRDASGNVVPELDDAGVPKLDQDGRPIPKRKDHALKAGFDAHVITVARERDWQAAELDADAHVADEVVLKDEAQVLPVAIVWVRPMHPR